MSAVLFAVCVSASTFVLGTALGRWLARRRDRLSLGPDALLARIAADTSPDDADRLLPPSLRRYPGVEPTWYPPTPPARDPMGLRHGFTLNERGHRPAAAAPGLPNPERLPGGTAVVRSKCACGACRGATS